MLGIDFERDLPCLMAVAAGLTLLGLIRLIFRSDRALLITTLVLSVGCVVALIVRAGRDFWLPLATLSTTALVLLAVRTGRIQALLRARHLQALCLLLIGPGLILATALAWRGPRELDVKILPLGVVSEKSLRPAAEHLATDRGHAVPLYSLTKVSADGGEHEWLEHWAEAACVVRTSPADQHYNCHGWVFAGGHGWLYPSEVECILRDNHYELVAEPHVGDLVVYRDGMGQAAHTGIVRVAEDGLVLVESKWGWLGRYVHAPIDTPYGTDIHYYRSPRTGHHLAGVDQPGKPAAAHDNQPPVIHAAAEN